MPKLYVAYRMDAGGPGQRAASGSMATLKTKIRAAVSSNWKIAVYNIKPDVPTPVAWHNC